MKNSLNRTIPNNGFLPYMGAFERIKANQRLCIPEVVSTNVDKLRQSIDVLFDEIPIVNGMTLSFHHHLRNGDYVLNMVAEIIKKRNLKNITIAPSAIFPIHAPLVELIEKENITKIYTNYMNGPVADAVSKGKLKELLVMDSHGGRPRAIESGELSIDVAFIAVPASDAFGNGNGIYGKSACGALGYAIADVKYAKNKIVITDYLVDKLDYIEIDGKYIDYVVKVDTIGDAKGIISGTTKPTKDPVQLKIAKDTAKLIEDLGYIKDGMSFQTGAGGTSLAVAEEMKKRMLNKHIKGSFASGGITSFLVEMQHLGLFERLYDVQCFDLEAVESYKSNPNHIPMNSSKYGNPYEVDPIVNQLDIVILGATEIDTSFNVNVTTDSHGRIIGGSGGHSDTAAGAKLTVITTNLIKSRMPIIKRNVTTITTPGETVDCVVTERGIAINPKRVDLLEKVKNTSLNIVTIDELLEIAHNITGVPNDIKSSDNMIGVIKYRDGSVIDTLYQMKGD